jgi:hypothetical protein
MEQVAAQKMLFWDPETGLFYPVPGLVLFYWGSTLFY